MSHRTAATHVHAHAAFDGAAGTGVRPAMTARAATVSTTTTTTTGTGTTGGAGSGGETV